MVWPQQLATAASAVAAGLPAAAVYQASSLVVRLSVKLFNCTPGDLPQGLREQLCNWLCATPAGAEGYIRPGCLHLTMQVLGPSYAAAESCYLWHVLKVRGCFSTLTVFKICVVCHMHSYSTFGIEKMTVALADACGRGCTCG